MPKRVLRREKCAAEARVENFGGTVKEQFEEIQGQLAQLASAYP